MVRSQDIDVGQSGLVLNIPNSLSLLRLVLAPLIMWLIISGRIQFAFWTFAVAGLSDALDGYLAKRFNWRTELGRYLDPLADKLLLVSIYVALGYYGELPSWLVIAVVSRDILIVMAVLLSWMLDRPMSVQPAMLSKINTAAQIVLVAVVLANSGFGLGLSALGVDMLFGFLSLPDPLSALIWITGILTVLSAAAYLRTWLSHMAGY